MKALIYFLVLLAAVCACRKQERVQPADTRIRIGPDTTLVCPRDGTQLEGSFIGKSKFVDEAKIFLPGGVVILHELPDI